MNLNEVIAHLEGACPQPRIGLPEEVFLLLARLMPMVNVDLFIRNDQGDTLLTWREDPFFGHGWHIPGGVIRLKETAQKRVAAVADTELNCRVRAEPRPFAIHEHIGEDAPERGHCVSLLYECRLLTMPPASLAYGGGEPQPGVYHFFRSPPADLLKVHDIYRQYIPAERGACHA